MASGLKPSARGLAGLGRAQGQGLLPLQARALPSPALPRVWQGSPALNITTDNSWIRSHIFSSRYFISFFRSTRLSSRFRVVILAQTSPVSILSYYLYTYCILCTWSVLTTPFHDLVMIYFCIYPIYPFVVLST